MLSWDEKDFLNKIPNDKLVTLSPYVPLIETIAQEIIAKINSLFPNIVVKHMGASALKISGQGDIDIYILSEQAEFDKYLPKLIEFFGNPSSSKDDSIAWKFEKSGHEIELYLTDQKSPTMQKQMKIFEILSTDEKLLAEYETLKTNMNGQKFKDYQRKKYEFYHKILGEK